MDSSFDDIERINKNCVDYGFNPPCTNEDPWYVLHWERHCNAWAA